MMLSEFWQLLWGIWLPFAPNFSGILNLDPDIPHHSVLKFENFALSKKKLTCYSIALLIVIFGQSLDEV